MRLGIFKWFRRKRDDEAAESRRLILEETQSLKKLLRKQSILIEEVRREQEAAAVRERKNVEPLLDLCDSVFHLQRAFRNPGLMSRQHAQVVTMVSKRLDLFASSAGVEMILDEGVPFDPRIHEAVVNRSPDSPALEVFEVIQPGYLRDGLVLRPAKVVVGAAEDSAPIFKGIMA
jgi:molecular chaperone GrpE (heat shock protein)